MNRTESRGPGLRLLLYERNQIMKATVLVDNIENAELEGEWGLSIYIEYKDLKILLDAGASDLFSVNAGKLGIDLSEVDLAVLSHAHYDHANGMPRFFSINKKAPFYLRRSADENCYKKVTVEEYIGMPKNLLRDYKDRIIFADGDMQIAEGVWIIPHKTSGLEQLGKNEQMYIKTPRGWKIDSFEHEQSLVFETEEGLVVFNSCSHGGADNIIKEIMDTFPGKKVRAIIGGFHLYNKTEDYVKSFAERVKSTGIEMVITGHCTGELPFDILKGELADSAERLYTGQIIEL